MHNTSEEKENMVEVARQRSNIYGFLATVFREEATAALIRQMKSPRFQEVLSDIGVYLKEEFFEIPEKKLVENLAVEYSSLFLGPGKHISPHESVHFGGEGGEGLLWGNATVQVKRFIESSGFEYKSDYRGMPDHISVEFEFMQEVSMQEALAWEKNDGDRVLHCRQIEKQFIEEHLTPWVPLFCEKVIKGVKLSFYGEIARLTKYFVEFEKEEIIRIKEEIIRKD